MIPPAYVISQAALLALAWNTAGCGKKSVYAALSQDTDAVAAEVAALRAKLIEGGDLEDDAWLRTDELELDSGMHNSTGNAAAAILIPSRYGLWQMMPSTPWSTRCSWFGILGLHLQIFLRLPGTAKSEAWSPACAMEAIGARGSSTGTAVPIPHAATLPPQH